MSPLTFPECVLGILKHIGLVGMLVSVWLLLLHALHKQTGLSKLGKRLQELDSLE